MSGQCDYGLCKSCLEFRRDTRLESKLFESKGSMFKLQGLVAGAAKMVATYWSRIMSRITGWSNVILSLTSRDQSSVRLLA